VKAFGFLDRKTQHQNLQCVGHLGIHGHEISQLPAQHLPGRLVCLHEIRPTCSAFKTAAHQVGSNSRQIFQVESIC
jgi:hypothetical protein